MKRFCLLVSWLFFVFSGNTQALQQKIDKAVKLLQADAQMKHAMMSLYVVETKTGEPVYALNEETGLAPASTQKIFTSVASFELLGANFRYKTELLHDGTIKYDTLKGNLIIKGSGDPTFGSWRYASTKQEVIKNIVLAVLQKASIRYIDGDIVIEDNKFNYQPLPGGWVWDDIGNYYGAGAWVLNWNENQYDLLLKPGNAEGQDVQITGTKPLMEGVELINLLKTGARGSGDNGYIYMTPYAASGFVTGTVPAGEKEFILSGSMPDPPFQFGKFIQRCLKENNILQSGNVLTKISNTRPAAATLLETIESPPLDSINYWFLQKSINLYGEALLKTIADQKTNEGSTERGVAQLKIFWQQNGIDSASLNIIDGSGLSPQNRVTTKSLVKALQFAATRSWYNDFFNALPLYNGIKMKSGTIGGSKAFAGYQSRDGVDYTFAIILNNFDTGGGSIVPKIYKVLDVLK